MHNIKNTKQKHYYFKNVSNVFAPFLKEVDGDLCVSEFATFKRLESVSGNLFISANCYMPKINLKKALMVEKNNGLRVCDSLPLHKSQFNGQNFIGQISQTCCYTLGGELAQNLN